MIAVLAVLAMQTASQPSQLEWIASIKIHAKRLNSAEVIVANHYASCISLPRFPLSDEFTAKHQKCRALPEIEKPSDDLAHLLDRLDAAVRQYPGSEATLSVVKN